MANLKPRLDESLTSFATEKIVLGSASPLDLRNRRKKGKKGKKVVKGWQYQGYYYYDTVNEVYYGANFYGNCLARIRLVGAENSSSLSEAPKETKVKSVVDAVRNFSNSRSGQTGLMRRFGQNMFIAGEVYLYGGMEKGKQNWEVFSTIELDDNDGVYTVRREEGEEPEELPSNATVMRIWKEHPMRAMEADSAMRTCQNECEKILLLDKGDMSVAKSRFAGAGVFLVPSELVPSVVVDDEGNIEDDPSKHPLIQGLQDSIIAPLVEDEQPEDVVPFVLVGQAEHLKEVRHVTMEKDFSSESEEKRIAAVRRMATAMDLPNEVLLGMEDTNHWTAWQIKEETFQTHIRPFVEMICNSLTVAYLHPQLKAAGVENYEKYVVWYDDTNLVARPDKTTVAQKAFEAIAISESTYLRELGFDENDKPDEEEFNRRAALAMRNPEGAWLLDGEDDPDVQRSKIIRKNDAKTPYPQDKSRPDPNEPGPAKSPLPGTDEGEKERLRKTNIQASGASSYEAYAQGYLEASIDRAIEKAGAKARTMFPKNSQAFELISRFKNHEIYAQLDSQIKEEYGIKDSEFLDFELACDFLRENGVDENYDFEAFKQGMIQETLRKLNQSKSNFSLNMDNLLK